MKKEWMWGVNLGEFWESSKRQLWSKYIIEIIEKLIKIYYILKDSKYIIAMYIFINEEDQNKTQKNVWGGQIFCFTERFRKLALECLNRKRISAIHFNEFSN